MSQRPFACVAIPEQVWEDASEEKDRSYLCAWLQMEDCDFHVEAIEVKTREPHGVQKASDPSKEFALESFYAAAAGDGPFQTVTIGGRDYVVCVTPFCT